MNNNLNEKLKELDNEEIIWIIYIGIILYSFYSNELEKDYFVNNNLESKKKYKETLIIIFTILTIIYFYFTKNAWESIQNLNITDSSKKKNLTYLSFIASLLILISGLIFLYIAFEDENIDIELAFN